MRATKPKIECLFVALIVLMLAVGMALTVTARAQAQMSTPLVGPVNPEFVAWQKEVEKSGLEMYDEEGHALGHFPSPFDWSHMRFQEATVSEGTRAPASYDMRTYGHVTPVRNQGGCGSCWAFATYGSLESWLLKNPGENWDFSENHLKNYHGFDWGPCNGGNEDISTAYLSRWSGPVSEADDPYHDWDDRPSPGGPCRKYLKSSLWFFSDSDIKDALMTYGAMYVVFHWDSMYYNSSEYTYYYNGADPDLNHAVTLIGWDDNKVVTGAPGNGAWLLKNSWGTSWGDNGYFWISYYDSLAVSYAVAFCDAVPPSSYATNYQHDPLGRVGGYGYGSTIAWGANVFTATASEDLEAVGFYAGADNTSYEIYVYDNFDGSTFSGLLGSVSGTVSQFGYHTITLPSPINLTNGDDFSIVIKFTTPGYNYPVPAEFVVSGYSSGATAGAGESYISSTGGSGTWYDLGAGVQANCCIKGLTYKEEPNYAKPLVPHTKWSQPPVEIDPNSPIPTYCGWDEKSCFLISSGDSIQVYENFDSGGIYQYYSPGTDLMADDIDLAGTNRELDHYNFTVYAPAGTAPYTVTSELYTDNSGYPGTPIAGTSCTHMVSSDYTVVLDCAPGTGVILPNNVWMVLSFSNSNAGWVIGESAELGSTDDVFAEYVGSSWTLYWFGGAPYAGFEANIWCESEESFEAKLVADDFRCIGSMPVTSIHWWGSFYDWEWSWAHGTLPSVLPANWWIGFWSNVPAGAPPDYLTYSHPSKLLHSITIPANRVTFEEVGSDEYYGEYPYDICYQYNVDLNSAEVFRQDDFNAVTYDNIYWISIVAEYNDMAEPYYKWGWKSRPWSWMDDAVTFNLDFEPATGFVLDPVIVNPIVDPVWGESFDMAFELDTDPNYIKWEQDFTGIRHWPHYEDVKSMVDAQNPVVMVFDDWRCLRRTPVTSIVWWGSYVGYGYEACSQGSFMPLPVKPDSFVLAIWTDSPAGSDPCYPFSHPNEPIWVYDAYDYDEVLVGYDKHPHGEPNEPVFRYSVRLPEDKWFNQPDYEGVFWLNVLAVYDINTPNYDWGWTNHKHVFNDNAVSRYYDDANGVWVWEELYDQTGASEDLSFMLFTDPALCSTCANYNCDALVNFLDYADFADDWLWTGSAGGYNNSDLNCDGSVDWYDVKIFTDQWLDSCP